MALGSSCVRWFESVGFDDVPLVGGKNSSLGEIYREMGSQGVRVPNGFALTVRAYYEALQSSHAWVKLQQLLKGLRPARAPPMIEREGRLVRRSRVVIPALGAGFGPCGLRIRNVIPRRLRRGTA
jgi:phosphoenolpyruvate synthase/pyruvate phosphate dikinase